MQLSSIEVFSLNQNEEEEVKMERNVMKNFNHVFV